jgi:Aldehyde dehydrogenase family
MFAVRNPATGAVLREVRNMGVAEVERAVGRAAAAGQDWARRTATQRADVAWRMYELLKEPARREQAASLITAEAGKPLSEAYAVSGEFRGGGGGGVVCGGVCGGEGGEGVEGWWVDGVCAVGGRWITRRGISVRLRSWGDTTTAT